VRRREHPRDTARVVPPERFFRPHVEDFVSPSDDPVDPGWSPLYRGRAEEELVWRFRMLAQDRYDDELTAFLQEHQDRRVVMTYKERECWRIGNPFPWRDQAGFMAQARR
jgi:hypothetical protein